MFVTHAKLLESSRKLGEDLPGRLLLPGGCEPGGPFPCGDPARRVVATVEFHFGQLFPRVGFRS
jgi:hypothetical protein